MYIRCAFVLKGAKITDPTHTQGTYFLGYFFHYQISVFPNPFEKRKRCNLRKVLKFSHKLYLRQMMKGGASKARNPITTPSQSHSDIHPLSPFVYVYSFMSIQQHILHIIASKCLTMNAKTDLIIIIINIGILHLMIPLEKDPLIQSKSGVLSRLKLTRINLLRESIFDLTSP